MLAKKMCKFKRSYPAVFRPREAVEVQRRKKKNMKSEWVVTDCFWVIAPHTVLDPPGPLHCIWPKTKLIAEDGDVRDGGGWAHGGAARLTLGATFVCANVCARAASITGSVWGSWRKHHRGLPQTHRVRVACPFFVVYVEGCVGVCKLCLKKLRPPQAVIALPSIKDTFAHFLWLTVYKTNNITHPWQLLLSLQFSVIPNKVDHIVSSFHTTYICLRTYATWADKTREPERANDVRCMHIFCVKRLKSSLFLPQLQGSGIGKDPFSISMQSSLFPLPFPLPRFSCTSATTCTSFHRSMFEIIESSRDNGHGFDSLRPHLEQKRVKEACHLFFWD